MVCFLPVKCCGSAGFATMTRVHCKIRSFSITRVGRSRLSPPTRQSAFPPPMLGQKSCKTKVLRICSKKCFVPNLAPNCLRMFCELFVLCFLGTETVFSKRCFSEWCVQRVVKIRMGRRHQMLENTGVFRHSLSLCKGLPLLQVEVRNPKNTV